MKYPRWQGDDDKDQVFSAYKKVENRQTETDRQIHTYMNEEEGKGRKPLVTLLAQMQHSSHKMLRKQERGCPCRARRSESHASPASSPGCDSIKHYCPHPQKKKPLEDRHLLSGWVNTPFAQTHPPEGDGKGPSVSSSFLRLQSSQARCL